MASAYFIMSRDQTRSEICSEFDREQQSCSRYIVRGCGIVYTDTYTTQIHGPEYNRTAHAKSLGSENSSTSCHLVSQMPFS